MKLTPQQVEQFNAQGYLIAQDIIPHSDFEPVIDEINTWLDRRARELHAEGKIKDLHEDEPFEKRVESLFAQSAEILKGIDIYEMRGRAHFEFLHNRHLLDAVECLIGPEITCNPIQHLRAKVHSAKREGKPTYGNVSDVPWHQDAGVTWDEADQSLILTCWIPLVNATRANGCMEILPKVERYLEHVPEGGTSIRSDELPTTTPICAECPKGGVVFMSQYTPHRGLSNQTPGQVRWTLDLRYQKTGTPTGRPFWPDFVVRSKDPSKVMRDHATWDRLWAEALVKGQDQPWHRHAKRAQMAAAKA